MWFIILQLVLITPKEGHVIISSNQGFETKALCESHLKDLEPKKDDMIKAVFGKDSTYKDIHIDCKEVKKESPA